ncbi:MAG: hypothetical protein ACI835_002370 [Planctomycetota bacterium]|jgi:hypothetical protein
MMITILLSILVSTPPAAARLSDAPTLHVQGSDGLRFVETLDSESLPTVLPTASRSERIVRIAPGRHGLRIVIANGGQAIDVHGVSFERIEHDSDQRVLQAPEGLWFAGPAIPPASLEMTGNGDVGSLVRRDGMTISDCQLTAHWGNFDGRLLVEGPRLPGPLGPRSALSIGWTGDSVAQITLPTGNAQALILDAPAGGIQLSIPKGAGIDRLSRARASRVSAADRTRIKTLTRAELAPIARRRFLRHQGQGAAYSEIELGRALKSDLSVQQWSDALHVQAARPLEATHTTRTTEGTVIDAHEALSLWFRAAHAAEEGRSATYLMTIDWSYSASKPKESRAPIEIEAASPAPAFIDIAPGTPLDIVHFEGEDLQLDIRPTMGPGAAFGDFDGDGWVDLYLIQGAGRAGAAPVRDRLLRNLGDGSFEDVTRSCGIQSSGAGMGALFFDAEGDGDLDLFVANYGADKLYLNRGDGRFEDVSRAVGLNIPGWSAAVVAGDADGDQDLDLYVTSYLDYDPNKMPSLEELGGYQREDPVEMLPFAFPAAANTYLRFEPAPGSDPPFRYVDATQDAGIADAAGRGMQALFWDFDIDGDQDLYVANDVSFNVLLRNEGAGAFHDVTFSIGLDDPRGGMGLALGDVDRDGDDDLFLTNWQLEANALYINGQANANGVKTRRSLFRDGTVRSGLGPSGVGVTSWAPLLFDAENDGDLDLFVANGYTSPDYESTGICVGQANHFFLGDGEGRFVDGAAFAGPALAVERASRCALACDFDQDGGVDILVTSNNGAAQLLHNRAQARGHWVGVRLRNTGPNSRAIGARVTVEADDEQWSQTLGAGTGYLGGNAPELHFGLGQAERIDRIHVRWPDGTTTVHRDVAIDDFAQLDHE